MLKNIFKIIIGERKKSITRKQQQNNDYQFMQQDYSDPPSASDYSRDRILRAVTFVQ